MKTYIVYIITNKPYGTLYVGFTSDLKRRIAEHKLEIVKGFSKKYNLKRLVYFEQIEFPNQGIAREKTIKRWCRKWKFELIEKQNPEWDDLYEVYFDSDDKEYFSWIMDRYIHNKE